MTSFVVKNNAESIVVDDPLTSGSLTLNVSSGTGSNFPLTFPFLITIWNETTYPDPSDAIGMEVVKCTGRTADALTIVRAQENTTDVEHLNGERVAMLITAGIFNDPTNGIATKLDGIEALADITSTHETSHADVLVDGDINVTVAAVLTSDENYVTDNEKVIIGNTSGSNTGDQDISGIGTNETAIGLNTTHRGLTNNPHLVDKTDVGLSNVPNTDCTNASNISSGTLASAVLPPVALTSVQVAVSQVTMLALTTEEGDVVVRSDENKSYMRNGGVVGDMTDFTELQTPTDSVLSVNTETGTVVLTTGNISEDVDHNYVTNNEKTVIGNTSNINTGDQSSIVGISGSKAEFDTAVSDGNITFDGDAPTAHLLGSHTTDTLANLNLIVTDATLIDTGDSRLSDARTPTAHDLDSHNSCTLVELNTDISDATLIDTADSRLSDARTPTGHNTIHVTGGTDIIADVVSVGNSGLMTGADKKRLDDIETAADVTDAVNIASSIVGTADKATPIDADTIPLIDSAAASVLKELTWSNVKATLKTYFDSLYNLYVHPNHSGDVTSAADGATTIAVGAIDIAMHSATGTPGATNYYRGDNTWNTPSGSGDMTKSVYDPNDDGVIASAQLDTGVFLCVGSRAMTSDLDMGTNNIDNCFAITANGDASELDLKGGENYGAAIMCCGKSHSTTIYRGSVRFFVPNAAGTAHLPPMTINGLTDTPTVDIYYGLDMNSKSIIDVLDPISAQDGSTKNYDDTHLFTKEAVTSFTDRYIPVYRTGSGKFEMVDSGTLMKNVVIKVIADDTTLTTGDGKTHFTIPIELNGMNLISVGAHVYTTSSSGLPNFQIHNLTDAVDILSTAITIDATEYDSKDATIPAVINTATDDVVTGDVLRFDCDGAGTGTKGMEIRLGFRLP